MGRLFITVVQTDPFYYFAVVLTVVISIVLHELAHGAVAIRLGDRTPILQNRMTGNPLVHMGPFSIVVLLVMGIAWGAMPIDPTRLRGRYAEAKVAFAGPAVNFLLALTALTALGLWQRFAPTPIDDETMKNGVRFLWIFGVTNLLLGVFNLLPVPPLDGSHILANFSRGYANMLGDPAKQGMWMLAFFFTFAMAHAIVTPIIVAGRNYLELLAGGEEVLRLIFW